MQFYISGGPPKTTLIYSDVWLPSIYSRRSLCFELPAHSSGERALGVLKRGFQSLVDGTPDLGGVVNVTPPSSGVEVPWKAIHPGPGIKLVVKNLRKSLMSYKALKARGFPITEFEDDVLMPIPMNSLPSGNLETLVQLNFIEGGMLLSFCAFHSLTDGNGMNAIMAALGEECKRAAEVEGTLAPSVLETDRSLLANVKGSKTDLQDHPAYSYMKGAWVPKLDGEEDEKADVATPETTPAAGAAASASTSPSAEAVTRIYRITGESAQALKTACTTVRISTHDAITALIWRTITIARHAAGRLPIDQLCTFTIPHNSRRHVGLDTNWIGNCTYFIVASLPCRTIIAENSLPTLAAEIRRALNAVNGDIVGGVFDLRKEQTYNITWWPLHKAHEPWILGLTSFYHSELYGADWGDAFGSVQHFTMSDEGVIGGFRRVGCVGAKLSDGRGCDVVLGLDEEERSFREDEIWRRYMEKLGQ